MPNFKLNWVDSWQVGWKDTGRLSSAGLPPGSPLKYVDPDTPESIGLSTEEIALLTVDQQTFFTGNTWPDFTTFYAAVSAQSWFNSENVMGTEAKGVAVYDSATHALFLNRGYRWFGLPTIAVYWLDADGNQILDATGNPIEVIA